MGIVVKEKIVEETRRQNMLKEFNGVILDLIDDSKMPSAEESKKIEIPEELRKRMSEKADKIAHELGYY